MSMGSMSLAEMIADFILSAEDEELARARAVLVKDAADVALERKVSMLPLPPRLKSDAR